MRSAVFAVIAAAGLVAAEAQAPAWTAWGNNATVTVKPTGVGPKSIASTGKLTTSTATTTVPISPTGNAAPVVEAAGLSGAALAGVLAFLL